MTDRLIRLMRIITLVQAKPGILARELAVRCGNSERTIYRDMDALSAMHIPITHLGHGKGYAFIGSFALYPLDWSDEEAAAFSQVRYRMEEIKPLLPPGFEGAYEKVMAAGYKQKAEREEKLETAAARETGPVWMDRSGLPSEQPSFLSDILICMMKQESIQVDYSENSHKEKGIVIDPYCLVPLENRFHLIGFCHRFGLIRTFHIQGFTSVEPLKQRFSKERFNLQSFMEQKWSLDQDSLQVEFKVRFTERIMNEITAEEVPVKPSKVDRETFCVHYKMSVEQDIGFVRWILKFEEEAEIVEPYYYRDMMKRQLEKWLSLYK
ncbi:WYL domain-containing protein [Paenibacillus albidus]|uniref:helix-turn-helix transcriptional regulator n=1 Tax=Paenibacillus albidus TaxID=2041023 RepID=UPI001BE5C85E|nr:WYL domain-containing protein [Paenibacillus albidus]MBT2292679.1 WYL domain-containing protein [Paenibacillus albidus]